MAPRGKRTLVGRETSESVADKPKTGEPKQGKLAGMEDTKIPALHKAAEKYVAIRDERMDLTEKETAAKAEVIDLMHEHKKKTYVCDGIEITLKFSEETVKVRKVNEDKEESEKAAD